jgi:hypothetical protein
MEYWVRSHPNMCLYAFLSRDNGPWRSEPWPSSLHQRKVPDSRLSLHKSSRSSLSSSLSFHRVLSHTPNGGETPQPWRLIIFPARSTACSCLQWNYVYQYMADGFTICTTSRIIRARCISNKLATINAVPYVVLSVSLVRIKYVV